MLRDQPPVPYCGPELVCPEEYEAWLEELKEQEARGCALPKIDMDIIDASTRTVYRGRHTPASTSSSSTFGIPMDDDVCRSLSLSLSLSRSFSFSFSYSQL